MSVKHTELPVRIRVAQDADGFWTCREAVSGSPEFIRADAVKDLVDALEGLRTVLLPSVGTNGGLSSGSREIAVAIVRSALARFKDLSAEKDQ